METVRSWLLSCCSPISSTNPGCLWRMGSTSVRILLLSSCLLSGFTWHSTMRVNIETPFELLEGERFGPLFIRSRNCQHSGEKVSWLFYFTAERRPQL